MIYFSDLSIFVIFAPVIQTVTIMAEYIHRNIDSELSARRCFIGSRRGKSVAEIDYLEIHNMKITPIEIKSGTQGGMKSLWLFMREKKLTEAFRCSLENFGSFDYIDKQDDDAIRHVTILPLYALSLLRSR